jgi:thiol-disulfide isomerase/thioredoxin
MIPEPMKPQAVVSAGLNRAAELRATGRIEDAAIELEKCVEAARATRYDIEFQTHVQLGMTMTDVYLLLERIDDARNFLKEETAFAERISQIMQATGTLNQKRMATSGYLQIRDRYTQACLLGEVAPDINLSTWLVGSPFQLADLRGRVVMLEFWATWCKPCQEAFPQLQALYEQEAANGLEIVAITRHYLAYNGTPEAKADELNLMRESVNKHKVTFPVGVTDNEQLQTIYGANGLPTVFLIDRGGIVRYAGPGIDDPIFKKHLQLCMAEVY